MKHFPIKKHDNRRKRLFIKEGIRTTLPKPKIPKVVFWEVHENKNIRLES
jgi:hypothetical protein